jgi:hypothetical protein
MIYVVAVSVLLGASTLVYVYKTAYHPQTKVGKETEATKTRPALPAFDTSDANRGWKLVFEDNFNRKELGSDWSTPVRKIELDRAGMVHAPWNKGHMVLNKKFERDVRLEYTLKMVDREKTDPHGAWISSRTGEFDSGYYFSAGRTSDATTMLLRDGFKFDRLDWAKNTPLVKTGKTYHIICQRSGNRVTYLVDGKVVMDLLDEESLTGAHVGILVMLGQQVSDVKVYTK